jgi:hypothetical protein
MRQKIIAAALLVATAVAVPAASKAPERPRPTSDPTLCDRARGEWVVYACKIGETRTSVCGNDLGQPIFRQARAGKLIKNITGRGGNFSAKQTDVLDKEPSFWQFDISFVEGSLKYKVFSREEFTQQKHLHTSGLITQEGAGPERRQICPESGQFQRMSTHDLPTDVSRIVQFETSPSR